MNLPTADLIKLVADAIPAAPDNPRTAESIAEEFGMTARQIHRAIARLKDSHPDLPLTSGERGYRWSRRRQDVTRHARKERRYVSTRVRRSLLDGLLDPYQRDNPAEAARARLRIEFILDDLARISGHVEEVSQVAATDRGRHR